VNYNEAIYDSGTIPDYKGNMTQRKSAELKQIPADTVTRAELSKEVAEAVGKIDPAGSGAAQEAANEVVHGIHFTNIHRIRDMELSLEEILAKIDQDSAEQAAGLTVTEDEILIKVADTEKELRAALDIQSSAVTAMVQGGGAEGQMSLSLELPVMIDANTRAKFVQAASEEEVSAVYAQLDGTDGENIRYAIKGNAARAAIKTLWDKAVAAALIASQIDLSATQINVAAENVVITGEANKGQTIIEGGYLRAELIEAEKILAKQLTIRNGGSLQSENYKADEAGWKISSDGSVEFTDGKFRGEINATTGILDNVIVNGFLESNSTPFQPMAMINFGYNNGAIQLTNGKNVKTITRSEKGVFTITLKKGVWLKTHSYNGNQYIDVFTIGNAADTFKSGFTNPLLINPNWLRQYVDGRLTQNNGKAYVDYVVLYCMDNSSDQLIDPLSAQCFIFGTESF